MPIQVYLSLDMVVVDHIPASRRMKVKLQMFHDNQNKVEKGR
jgi:hypothetical protein